MQKLILANIVAFAICLAVGPAIIPALKRLKFGQMVRDDGPQSHLVKAGTPTMGGVLILIGLFASSFILSGTDVEFVWAAALVTAGYALVGFLDDFLKIKNKRSLGLRAYQKIIGQFGLAVVVAVFAYNHPLIGSKLIVPFSSAEWDLGIFYVPFIIFVVIALVNSVNLTDGLDGLASGVTLVIGASMGLMVYAGFAAAQGSGELLYSINMEGLMMFTGALTGACLGFLRFNTYPARVFMGDTGSLALGGALSMIFIMSRMTLLLPVMGGMFVASSVSVILQVGSYKLRGKRVFKMAPLHHHFELKGLPETRVVTMYMIITAALCLVGLLAIL